MFCQSGFDVAEISHEKSKASATAADTQLTPRQSCVRRFLRIPSRVNTLAASRGISWSSCSIIRFVEVVLHRKQHGGRAGVAPNRPRKHMLALCADHPESWFATVPFGIELT